MLTYHCVIVHSFAVGWKNLMKNKFATTKDLLLAINVMEEEKLPLDAEVLCYTGEKEYKVVGIGHFHLIPNMTLTLEPNEKIS